jgi:hypothetical protein
MMWVAALILLLSTITSCIVMNSNNYTSVKGELLTKQKITRNLNEHPKCVVEVGNNFIIKVNLTETKALFRTESRYVQELLIELKDIPSSQQRIIVPDNIVSMCYQEGFQYLVFEAYQGQGWIDFEEVNINKKKITGNLNLSLINLIDSADLEKIKSLHYHLHLQIK